MANLTPEGQAALDLCKKLLDSLTVAGAEGRAQFESTLAPDVEACHARPSSMDPSKAASLPAISYEKGIEEFASRIPWNSGDRMVEGIDDGPGGREVVVHVDHDIAMVWTPYWFKNNGALTHVGSNCFTLAKHSSKDASEDWEWKIVGMTDTGRFPSEQDKERLK